MKLDDLAKWRIEQLGLNGGFSHRFIAQQVFGKTAKEVDETDLNRVRHVLRQREVSVMGWRNGVTTLAKAHAKTAAGPRRRGVKRRRVA